MVWLSGRRALPTRGSRLLPILVLGSCPGRQQSAQPPPRGQRGSHPHAPRPALLGVDASPPPPVRRCLLPRPQGLRALDSAWPGRASERAQCGSAGPGVAVLGARGSPRPDGFCVLRTGQQSQPQSSQSDYSKAWEDYYRKQSECGAFPAGRPRSQLRARGLTVHGPGRHPFFHVCLCASVSVLTFVSLCPSVSDAE